MKKRLLMLMSLVLLCATVLSLGACTDPAQPRTDEPDTAQPQTSVDTSGDKIDEVTQENVAEAFMPSLEAYVYYAGSAFYSVEESESDNKGTWYKVAEYNEFAPIEEQMKTYMSEDCYDGLMRDVTYEERDDGLYIHVPAWIMRSGAKYDISSIDLIESDGDMYKIAVGNGNQDSVDDPTCRISMNLIYTATLTDGKLVIDSAYSPATPELAGKPNSKTADERLWIGEQDKFLGLQPRVIEIDPDKGFHITDEPITPETSESGEQIEITQDNIAEVFMPSLEAYLYYMGSEFYTVEKDENGEPKSYPVEGDGMEIAEYKINEYDNFSSIESQMRKYLSEYVYQSTMMRGEYIERDDGLFIVIYGIDTAGLYDITSIKLVDASEGRYRVSIDFGLKSGSDEIADMDNLIFTTTLKDGVLVIEAIDVAKSYSAEEIIGSTPAEERLWIGQMDKINGEEPRSIPFISDFVSNE